MDVACVCVQGCCSSVLVLNFICHQEGRYSLPYAWLKARRMKLAPVNVGTCSVFNPDIFFFERTLLQKSVAAFFFSLWGEKEKMAFRQRRSCRYFNGSTTTLVVLVVLKCKRLYILTTTLSEQTYFSINLYFCTVCITEVCLCTGGVCGSFFIFIFGGWEAARLCTLWDAELYYVSMNVWETSELFPKDFCCSYEIVCHCLKCPVWAWKW